MTATGSRSGSGEPAPAAVAGGEAASDDPGRTRSHRGAFGEYGGAAGGLIERTFRERIVLVGVVMAPHDEQEVNRSLDELALLVDTAGADEVGRVIQHRRHPEPATYIGSGKVAELRARCDEVDADTVVFDDELTPAQQFNLEKALGRSALDRTAVILDIFGQNAHSTEGKAQVALAQLRYRLPRLRGLGLRLSRQEGGIGARRGPGETKLEIDRRRIERRLHRLERELRDIGRVRSTQRQARRRAQIRTVAIVGYTNAGKSTLLNRLTGAGVLVEDRLFATLDATTRRLGLPGGETVLVSDTVGFVTKLPHQLVEAFKSTLEVVTEADLVVHVVDAAGADPAGHMEAVRSVLAEIGADGVPELVVFNKADRAGSEAVRWSRGHPGSVVVSARTGEGIGELRAAIADRLRSLNEVVELVVPFDRGDILAAVHREGEVLVQSTTGEGMRIRARLDEGAAARLGEFVVMTADRSGSPGGATPAGSAEGGR